MITLVSLSAAAALVATFFGIGAAFRRLGVSRFGAALLASVLAGIAWFVAVSIGRMVGGITTEEAWFHHLYVLGVVGLPLGGFILAVIAVRRARPGRLSRRLAWASTAAVVVPLAAGIWGTHIEPNWLRVDRAVIELAVVADGEPIRIGVIADIQTDSFGAYERSAMDAMIEERPDLIVIAGDNTEVSNAEYQAIRGDLVDLLSLLEAPYGVFVVMGNNDPSSAELADAAIEAGLVPLIDDMVEIDVRGQTLRLGGLDWPNTARAGATGFVRQFAAAAGDDTVDILIAHSPDAILNLEAGSTIDLLLAGHTHGGQIALPFVGPLWNVTEFSRDVAGGGLHELRGTPTYVSTGVGVLRGEAPKVRFGVRPSIGILTLR